MFMQPASSIVAYKPPYKFKAWPSSSPRPLTQKETKASALLGRNKATRGNTGPTTAGQQQQDTTALEIANSDALFGLTGADEPWAWSDAANWHPATSAPLATRGNHNPRKTGGTKKATGGDAPSMGNLRHKVAGTSHQLPRMKTSSASGANPNSGPAFHHFLERSSSTSSSTNSLLYPSSSLDASVPINTAGKRPRSSTSNSFLTPPLGYPSPPPFESDHPLPDFNHWGFGRSGTRSSGAHSSTSATTSTSYTNAPTTTTLSTIGSGLSSPNGGSMFAGVDSFLPDYDSTLYSLWNAPSGGGVMDYDTENDAPHDQHQQAQPPMYLVPEDELKMDYPQLTEFNQDLDSYLNDTMASPTTPLGTSSMMKMDQLVTADRKTGSSGLGTSILTGTREPQMERLLAPATATSTTEYPLKRGRETANTSEHLLKRQRGGYGDGYGATGSVAGLMPTTNASSFRSVSKNAVTEPKRAMPPLGSFHNGPSPLMLTSAASSHAGNTSTGIATPKSTTSDTATAKAGKRPRSRQCEFPGCQNRARSHQKCKKHGGAHQCVFEGCMKNSQSRGLCIAHGGGSRCKKEGCVRAAQSKGLCKSHGGGEFCAVEGCNKKAHLKHLCRTHGGGVRCKVDKCLKWAQRKGWCMAHAKEFSVT